MAFSSGRDGSLYVDGTRVARVSNWSLSGSVEVTEVTNLGDTERHYTPGLKSSQGSATIFYYDDAPKVLISKVFKTGAATDADMVQLSLRWSQKKIEVNAFITQAEVSCQVGSVMQATVSFQVTGDYTALDLGVPGRPGPPPIGAG